MRNLLQIISLTVVLILSLTIALAQSNEDPSENKDSRKTENSLFITRPINTWIGERFIFLQRRKSLQKYGYQSFSKASPYIGSAPNSKYYAGRLLYEKYVGRIARVVKITPSPTKVQGAWDIELVLEDNGEKVYADAVLDNVDGIAPLADIINARRLYLGKTLWYQERTLDTYKPEIDETGIGDDSQFMPTKI
jgi:hypothetical protein